MSHQIEHFNGDTKGCQIYVSTWSIIFEVVIPISIIRMWNNSKQHQRYATFYKKANQKCNNLHEFSASSRLNKASLQKCESIQKFVQFFPQRDVLVHYLYTINYHFCITAKKKKVRKKLLRSCFHTYLHKRKTTNYIKFNHLSRYFLSRPCVVLVFFL